jgi:dihydrofolate reductase
MSRVFLDLSMSLDGFVAGPDVGPEQPMGREGERLHDWMFTGKTDEEAAAFQTAKFRNVGAVIIGRRTLDLGLGPWGDNPAFHAPCFVVTSRPHETIVREGGTSYTFVTKGIEGALAQARTAAGGKDIMVLGGADLARQYLEARLLDEMQIHLVPLLLGGGTRLFGESAPPVDLEPIEVAQGSGVVHLRYRVPR